MADAQQLLLGVDELHERAADHTAKAVACATSKRNTSPSTNSEPSRPVTSRAKRVRKSTYAVRRDEAEQLLKEIAELETRALELRQCAEGRLSEKQLLNAILREARHGQQLSLAVAQSVVSGALSSDQTNPLHTFIHLGKDWSERRKTLQAMKEPKLCNALDFVQARSQFLDPLRPHTSEERFENAHGHYCYARFDLIQFEGVESVQQVYDTLLFYLLNMEISVSERTGHITVREDYDTVDQSILHYRLRSTQFDVSVETALVLFTRLFGSDDGSPCGVVAAETVDCDELYPFSPQDRVRKDVSSAIVLSSHMRRKEYNGSEKSSDGEEELVVVMTRAKFLKLHKSEFEISPQALQGLRENMCWGAVMVTTINELLHPEFAFPGAHEKESNIGNKLT